MSKRKQGWVSEPEDRRPFHHAFASLAGRREARAEDSPDGEGQAPPSSNEGPSSPALADWGSMSLRLWHERKGRAGKTVTMVGGFGSQAEAQAAATVLSRSLGCGAQVEGVRVVLQGDQRQRAPVVLAKQGVGRLAK